MCKKSFDNGHFFKMEIVHNGVRQYEPFCGTCKHVIKKIRCSTCKKLISGCVGNG